MMEKNGMIKRLLVVTLLVIAMIGTNIQGTSVFAETLSPEVQNETVEGQPESQEKTLEEGESDEQTETEEKEPSEAQTETPEGESEEQTETVKEQSVSGNDIPAEAAESAEDQTGTVEAPVDEGADDTKNTLNDEILKECIVEGMNPPGVTVNLFDYSQGIAADGNSEVAHDYYYKWSGDKPAVGTDPHVNTYNLGISENHLLRFGYRGKEENDYCILLKDGIELGDYGDWNEYRAVRYTGIVQNKLYNGYPRLNLDLSQDTDYGRYADNENRSTYLTEYNKTEPLAYLFEPYSTEYKTSYRAVQGLFQQRADGYYYYDSRLNFASFNDDTNSFTLYNSPGVANVVNGRIYSGQFFPFNKVTDVFDDYYKAGDNYRLTYNNKANNDDGDTENNYAPIKENENGYLKCYAPNLNHYLGLTLEMSFVQPIGGRVTSGNDKSDDMIFEFSGDDDVWIFIDDVLVADLGGLHDALGLSINFATGVVKVEGKEHTLYDSFVTAYGEDSIPDGIKFSEVNGRTFADNTVHTLKMFYLERGHMASNLSLSFNIQTLESMPNNNEENSYETEEYTSDSDVVVNVPVEIPVNDNTLFDSPEIPKTGDDSLIGWWAALCIISLVGIGATVCNLVIRKRKQDKQS